MDYGQVNKDTLRQLLEQTPDTPQNRELIASISRLLSAKTIEPFPYTYVVSYWVTGANNSIAAGAANQPGQVNIQADADFLILNQTYHANTANAAIAVSTAVYPNLLVTLTETGSGMALMNAGVPVPAIFGDGRQPFILPQPKLLLAKATLQVSITSFDAAAGYNLFLAFNGVKLYAYN